MKFKIKLIALSMVMALSLTACKSGEGTELFNDGQVALEKHEYKTAMQKFSDVLEGDSENKVARDMYGQAMRMLRVEEYENDEEYEKALKEIEKILRLKNGSSKIKKEAEQKKVELEKLVENLDAEREERKQNAKEAAKNNKGQVESDALHSNATHPNANKPEKPEDNSSSSGGSSSGGSSSGNSGSSNNSGNSGNSGNQSGGSSSGGSSNEGGTSAGNSSGGSSSGGESSGGESAE